MSDSYTPVQVRRQVKQDAGSLCGYCHCSERVTSSALVLEHIKPKATGGETVRENLWLACVQCNQYKSDRTHASDPLTDEVVPLYNPRTQSWAEHFTWDETGCYIIGVTAMGRATVEALQLNRELAVTARQFWVSVGWHPPRDDLSG